MSEGAQAGGSGRLTLVSWNIHSGIGTDGRFDLPRVAAVLEALSPDITALQEVGDFRGRTDAEAHPEWLADRLGLHMAFGPNVVRGGRRSGTAVLTRLPIVRNSVKHYFRKEPKEGLNPDEVVSMGAALQAHALLDSRSETFLVDVTPLPLRIGTVGGFTEKIIDKNTPIPIEKGRTFTTSRDGQDKVKIRVCQGESNKFDECELLGEFEFSGFRIGFRGEVKIEVNFEINTDGIVNVTARDVETGQATSTTIALSSGLSEADIKAASAANQKTQLAGHGDLPAPA
jgi:hypothetical protein